MNVHRSGECCTYPTCNGTKLEIKRYKGQNEPKNCSCIRTGRMVQA
jgi:hypothetical protein